MNGSIYEAEMARRLQEILGEAFELPKNSMEVEPRSRQARVDLVIRPDSSPPLVIELKSSARSVDVEQAARAARAAADELHGVPVVVVPYMGEAGRRVAEEVGVSWIDLSGNANVRADNIILHVQGKPNLYARRGRPSSPFARVSSRVPRLMLLDPARWWRQAELARAGDLREGQVSKVVGRLLEMELVERREDRAVRPRDPGGLLDAWAEDYDFGKHTAVYGHTGGSGAKLARDVSGRLRKAGVEYALTGLPAAWLRDRFAQFRLVSIYVEEDPVAVGEDLGVRLEPRGANVQLVHPNDPGVFFGSEKVDGVRCVSAVQTYLDLLGLPERADEAAAHLRAEHLTWDSHGR
jgi:hypothetical protein